LIDDELDELATGNNTRTMVMDFKDLETPSYKGFYEADGTSVDHNQYTVGDHTFQANYTGGLRILELGDLSEPEMKEVAYFDTCPDNPQPCNGNFSGAWNVYPFFDNGIVIVADTNRGVFILKPNLPTVDLIFIDGLD